LQETPNRDQWTLKYHALDHSQKTAVTLRTTDSGLWKETTVKIADGRFQ